MVFQSTQPLGSPVDYNVPQTSFEPIPGDTTVGDVLKYQAPAALMAFYDTVGSAFGLDTDAHIESLKGGLMSNVVNYYNRQPQASQMIGDLAGMFIPGTAAVKALRGGRAALAATGALASRPLAAAIMSPATGSNIMRKVAVMDKILASRTGNLAQNLNSKRAVLATQAKIANVGNAVADGVAFEAGVAGAMHTSEFLYPSDSSLTDHLAWASLGVVLPGGFEYLVTRKQLSNSLRNAVGQAQKFYQPGDLPINALSRPGMRDINVVIAGEGKTHLREMATAMPTETARRESIIGLSAAELNQQAQKNINAGLTQQDLTIKKLVEQTKKEGLVQPDGTKFAAKAGNKPMIETTPLNPYEMATLTQLIDEDPYMYLGTRAIQKMQGDNVVSLETRLSDFSKTELDTIDKRIKKLTKKAAKNKQSVADIPEIAELEKRREHAKSLAELQVHVVEPTGEIIKGVMRKQRFYDEALEGKIVRQPAQNAEPGRWNASYATPKGRKTWGIDDSGLLHGVSRAKNATKEALTADNTKLWDEMNMRDHGAVFAAMQRAEAEFNIGKSKVTNLGATPIGENEHWTRYQHVLNLLEKDEANAKFFSLPDRFKDRDALRYEIFMQKAQGMFRDMTKLELGLEQRLLNNNLSMDDLLYKYDLPALDVAGQPELIVGLISEMRFTHGITTRADAEKLIPDWRALKNQLKSSASYDLETPIAKLDNIALRGKASQVPMIDGKPQQPIALVKSPVSPEMKAREYLNDYMATRTAAMFDALVSKADPSNSKNFLAGESFVGELARIVFDPNYSAASTAAFQASKQIDQLYEFDRFLGGAVSQKVHQFADIPAMAALQQNISNWDRRAQEMIGAIYRTPMQFYTGKQKSASEAFAALRGNDPKSQASNTLFNSFVQARRHGWNVHPEPVQIAPGKWGFRLNNTDKRAAAFNNKIWKQIYQGHGDTTPEFMPLLSAGTTPNGRLLFTPLIIDDAALEAAQAISEVGKTTLRNGNLVRKQLGLPEINMREWWVPPKNFAAEGQHVSFIKINPADDQLRVISAPTQAELTRRIAAELDAYRQSGHANAFEIPKTQLARYHDLQDQAFAQMVDMSDSLRQTGGNKGASGLAKLESGNQLSDLVDSLTRQLNSVSRRTRGLVYEKELAQARRFAELSEMPKGVRNIFSQYASDIMGGSDLLKESMVGKVYGTIESVADEALEKIWDATVNYRGAVKSMFQPMAEAKAEKMLGEMRKKLGDHMPYDNATQFLERLSGTATPPKIKEMAIGLNYLTSTLTLRLLEVGHAILNLTSLAATTPAVIRALNKMPTETHEQWTSRIGAWGTMVKGKDTPVLHPSKLLTSVTHDMFADPAMREAWREASDLGYFKQQVSEIMQTLVEPSGKSILSNPGVLMKWATWLSDSSEEWTRSFAHMTGYWIAAKQFGIQAPGNRHVFAHKFANDIIGDYRPGNKPQIFQGTVGMPLGLFQTFMWNYFHRLFSYVENKQWKALATQYATQASVFGAQTVPGFQQYSEIFATNYDGTKNPVDNVRSALGPDMADLYFYGALSNIPKIWGADDGVALYTRGDANVVRIPSIFTLGETAPARLAGSVASIVGETVDMFSRGGQYSNQQLMEIVGRHFINRPIRHAFEMAAGVSTDKYGQLISDDTRTGLSIAARLMGTKPMMEAKASEVNYRIRSSELSQRAIRERMRDGARSMFRDGTFDQKTLESLWASYSQSGGRPDYFGPWLRDNMLAARMTRTDRQFQEFMKNPARHGDLARLVNMGMLGGADEEFTYE